MAFGFIPDTLFIALLTSTILAGVRRSSGLTFQTEQLVTNPTGVKVFSVYLSVGEWVSRCLSIYRSLFIDLSLPLSQHRYTRTRTHIRHTVHGLLASFLLSVK